MSLRNTIWFYSTAVGVVVIDQITKLLARRCLALDQPVKIIPGFFDLKLVYNTGAAFGVLPDWAPLFIIIALVAIFAIVRLRGVRNASVALAIGLGLLLGGAIGNLIDRLAFPDLGVTDFLNVHVKLSGQVHSWPTFNFADAAIVIGAFVVVFRVYVIEKRREEAEEEEHTDEGLDQDKTQD